MRSRGKTAGWRSLRGYGLCLVAALVVAMSVMTGPLGENVEAAAAVADAGGGPVAQGLAWTPPLQANCADVGGGHFSGAHCVVVLARAPSSNPSPGAPGFPQAPEVPQKAGGDRPPHPPPRALSPV